MEDAWERLLRERGYRMQHTLGEGAYSKVKSAFSTRLGRDVAIKCINTRVAPRDFVEKFLPRELQTLPRLRHENIVRVYEILEASDGYVYIIMEAAANGDMLRYVQRRGALPEAEIKRHFWQLSQAINYCHSQNICHRDLKCENLLLDKNNKLLLTDFGFSKPIEFDSRGNVDLSSTFCGSAAYAAPEIIQGRPYDPRMHDMWSMGVILYIMSCGHMPFDDSNVKKMLKVQLRNQVRFPPRINEVISDRLKSLIRRLIQPDVTQRATMDQVFSHPFFEGYREEMSSRVSSPNAMKPSTPSSGSSSVAQQIFDFFTRGRPHSSSRSGNGEEAGSSRSSSRRHSRTLHDSENGRHDRRRDCTCSPRDGNDHGCQGGSRDSYDRKNSSPSAKRCRHHRRKRDEFND